MASVEYLTVSILGMLTLLFPLLLLHLLLLLLLYYHYTNSFSSSHTHTLFLTSSPFRHEMSLSVAERRMITDLGYTLVDQLDRNMVIFPSSLLSALLLQQQQRTGEAQPGIHRGTCTSWVGSEVTMATCLPPQMNL